MAAQTPVEARARDVWVEELPDHGEQVVERHQQRFAQNHRHRLLRRGQCGLRVVRGVTAVITPLCHAAQVIGQFGADPIRENQGLAFGLVFLPRRLRVTRQRQAMQRFQSGPDLGGAKVLVEVFKLDLAAAQIREIGR